MKNKVVLFYPRYDGPPLSAPLCLLALASPLLQSGYRVAVIDAAITENYEERIEREIADPDRRVEIEAEVVASLMPGGVAH